LPLTEGKFLSLPNECSVTNIYKHLHVFSAGWSLRTCYLNREIILCC
jgi:hypothetical protein